MESKHKIILVSWRLQIFEIDILYNDTENFMTLDGHTLPRYFVDGFFQPTTKTPQALIRFSNDFCLVFTSLHYKTLLDE